MVGAGLQPTVLENVQALKQVINLPLPLGMGQTFNPIATALRDSAVAKTRITHIVITGGIRQWQLKFRLSIRIDPS